MDSPAAQAAAEQGISLNKIPLPIIETYEPAQLVAAAAAYAAAVLKTRAAEQAVAKIKAEQVAREKRIALLQEVLDALPDEPIHIWCCTYTENLAVGSTVKTMEVPGYWIDDSVPKTVTLYADTSLERTVAYDERSLNIAPWGWGFPGHGSMTPSEALSDAAIFYNLAMEPGHLKWKPAWRYGTLLTSNQHHAATNTANVQLDMRRCRGWDDLPIDVDENEFMTGVPIHYPYCHGVAFEYGDEVLIIFNGQERDQPMIIGFRRKPRKCRPTWREIVPGIE